MANLSGQPSDLKVDSTEYHVEAFLVDAGVVEPFLIYSAKGAS